MIDHVVKFSNGMVMVFDEKGEHLLEYQGRYQDVKAKILAHAPKSAKFFRAVVWMVSGGEIPRKEW